MTSSSSFFSKLEPFSSSISYRQINITTRHHVIVSITKKTHVNAGKITEESWDYITEDEFITRVAWPSLAKPYVFTYEAPKP